MGTRSTKSTEKVKKKKVLTNNLPQKCKWTLSSRSKKSSIHDTTDQTLLSQMLIWELLKNQKKLKKRKRKKSHHEELRFRNSTSLMLIQSAEESFLANSRSQKKMKQLWSNLSEKSQKSSSHQPISKKKA